MYMLHSGGGHSFYMIILHIHIYTTMDGVKSATEQILERLLETSTSQGSVKVDTLNRESISMEGWVAEERVRLARSQAVQR